MWSVDTRERALLDGLERLTDGEVIALLLSTGSRGRPVGELSQALLEEHDGLVGLSHAAPLELARQVGVGEVKGLRLSAAFELARRAHAEQARSRELLSCSEDVANWMRPKLGQLRHEEMWVLAVDGQNRIRAQRRVAQGGLHGCAVSARDILRTVLSLAASGFVLVHNHPSNNPSPSIEDVRMTQSLFEAAELVGVALLDHVIVCGASHCSLLDSGLLDGSP